MSELIEKFLSPKIKETGERNRLTVPRCLITNRLNESLNWFRYLDIGNMGIDKSGNYRWIWVSSATDIGKADIPKAVRGGAISTVIGAYEILADQKENTDFSERLIRPTTLLEQADFSSTLDAFMHYPDMESIMNHYAGFSQGRMGKGRPYSVILPLIMNEFSDEYATRPPESYDPRYFIEGIKYLSWSIDHQKLIKYLHERYNAQKVIYYAGLEKGDSKKQDFYQKIKSFGFEVKIKPVVVYKGKSYWKSFICPVCKKKVSKKFQNPPKKKANCDVDLAIDAIKLSSSYKTLLLFSGDNDFSSIIDYLKEKRKKTIVFSSMENCGRKLRQTAYGFVEINQLRQILELKP